MNFPAKMILLLVIGLSQCLTYAQNGETAAEAPNIVYILADDMGYGDIQALNANSKISTPHLNRLTNEGMHFTDAHSGSAVCTPTRYGILTGRYAWRTKLKNGVTWSWDPPLIAKDRTTVASMLKKRGYQTGCIGKWHLGLGWEKDANDEIDITLPLSAGPNDLGFDYFFGITASLDIPPYIYIENNQSTSDQIDSIDGRPGQEFWRPGQIGHDFDHMGVLPKLTEKARDFISESSNQDDPFFLYFPLPAPHTPILPTPEFVGKSKTNLYGDFVMMVDDVVGQVMEALEESGVAENTLIIFTADNGTSPRCNFPFLDSLGHQPSYLFRGHKADIFEGGHRVPFVARWPASVSPGSKIDHTICLTDLLATAAELGGEALLENEGEDSYSFLPLLLNQEDNWSRPKVVNHSINGSFAIRDGDWKLNICPGSGGWSHPTPKETATMDLPEVQLYNLRDDIGEKDNLAGQFPEKVQTLTDILQKYIDDGRSTTGGVQMNDTPTVMGVNK